MTDRSLKQNGTLLLHHVIRTCQQKAICEKKENHGKIKKDKQDPSLLSSIINIPIHTQVDRVGKISPRPDS